MKSVLISIKPEWCSLIANKKKTVEVRKTKPKIETPFKCYIYMTQPKHKKNKIDTIKDSTYSYYDETSFVKVGGTVIGEFVCDEIKTFPDECSAMWLVGNSCVRPIALEKYAGDNAKLFAWHISELVIYDKPKELGEFMTAEHKSVKRPPQSWYYVER
jgi:predicted transcriptional regulator